MSSDLKVLIVDDDHALADLLVIMLSLDGFRSEAAYSGRQALDAIEREVPAAVILDIMMPDMDGFAVLREIRGNARADSVAVLMLSARVDQETRDQSLAAGADSYLTKPAEPQHLTAEIRQHIARRAGQAPA